MAVLNNEFMLSLFKLHSTPCVLHTFWKITILSRIHATTNWCQAPALQWVKQILMNAR